MIRRSQSKEINILILKQEANFDRILQELEIRRKKVSHWVWWVWPTSKEGFSEPSSKTSVTKATAELLLKSKNYKKWVVILLKVCKLCNETSFKEVIPWMDHDRIGYFLEFWLQEVGETTKKYVKFHKACKRLQKIYTEFIMDSIDPKILVEPKPTSPIKKPIQKMSKRKPSTKNSQKKRGQVKRGGQPKGMPLTNFFQYKKKNVGNGVPVRKKTSSKRKSSGRKGKSSPGMGFYSQEMKPYSGRVETPEKCRSDLGEIGGEPLGIDELMN